MKRYLVIVGFAVLIVNGALAQQKKSVPPPPKPKDDGPSLEVTMKFIQDKMNDQGTVGYVYTRSNFNGVLFRHYYLISDAVVDASRCTLQAKEKETIQVEVAAGTTYTEGGKAVSGDNLNRESSTESTSPLKDVDSIRVESAQDGWNRRSAEAAHPEVTFTFTPAVYHLSVIAAKKDVFSFRRSYSKGKESPQTTELTGKENTFTFRDEETANRVAKAMLHAVELCGGGNKDPF